MPQVDYKHQRLVMKVGIGGTEPTSNLKSLSGGERSLSALSFILSLGGWVGGQVGGWVGLLTRGRRGAKAPSCGVSTAEGAPPFDHPWPPPPPFLSFPFECFTSV